MKNTNINAALLAKQNKSLDIKMNYSEGGIMSRRDWLKMQMVKGAEVKEGTKNRIEFNRTKFNRMSNQKEQDEYYKKCTERIGCYELHLPGQSAFWEITKTEFDYFKNLQLAEDKATEAMELTYKIDAGTATNEEIKQDEQKEFEFFSKYANQ